MIVRYRVNLLWIEFEECLPRKGVVHSSNLGMDDWAQDIWGIRTQQSIWWILTQNTTYVQVWVTWSEFESVSPFIPASKDPQNSFNSYSREPLKTFRSESRRAPARLVQGKLQNLGCSSAQRGWPGSRRRCWSPAAEFSHYWTSRHPASHPMTPLVFAPDRVSRRLWAISNLLGKEDVVQSAVLNNSARRLLLRRPFKKEDQPEFFAVSSQKKTRVRQKNHWWTGPRPP